jgi:hypothetical protein
LSQFLPGDINASRAKTASNLWARTLFSLFNYFFITRLSAGYIYLNTKVFNLLPGLAKIAPWCLARRETFVAKVPRPVASVTAPPTLSAHTRNRYVQPVDILPN